MYVEKTISHAPTLRATATKPAQPEMPSQWHACGDASSTMRGRGDARQETGSADRATRMPQGRTPARRGCRSAARPRTEARNRLNAARPGGCTRAHPRPPSTSHIRTARARDATVRELFCTRSATRIAGTHALAYAITCMTRGGLCARNPTCWSSAGHRRNHRGDRGGAGRGRNHDSLRGTALWRFKFYPGTWGLGS